MSLRKTVQTAALADASRDLTGLVKQVKAILPQFTEDVICQVLAEEDENVERAIETLLTRPEPARRPNKKKDRGGGAGGSGGAASSASPTEPANAAANGQVKARSSQASGDAGGRGKQQQSSTLTPSPQTVAEERPKTPAEKEAQKYRKKLREIEAIEERLRRGEKVDHLQEEKVQHKRDFQIQLTAAERKAEKEVAEQTAKMRKEAAEKARLEAAAAKASQANQQASATAAVSANARRWNQQAPQPATAPPTGQQHPPNHGEFAEPQEEWPAEAASDAQDHLLRLQQEQMHREQLERELLAEKAQREELERQLGIERLEREQLDRLNQMRQQGQAAPILPPPQDNGRLQERQPRTGAPAAPPTVPPATAPPSMPPSAAPPAAAPPAAAPAAGGGGGTEQRGQELLSLLHSSTSRPDASHSYEQSANLAKQLGGGQFPYGVRPVHASPQAPPPAQGGGGFQTMQQRPVQSRQQPHEQQQPRTREHTQWSPSIDSMRVDAAGSGASGQGPPQPRFGHQPGGAVAGKESGEDDQQFLNQYSTPLNEMTFTKEQREAAERIAREIEKGGGAGPKTSGATHWAGDGHGHGSEWRGGRGGGRSWQHDWSDSKGGSGGKGGGKGFRRGGGGGKSAPGS